MRTFTANFLAQCDLKASTPYVVLEIDFGGATGTKYYMDRPTSTLTAAGTRAPATVEAPRVVEWPRIELSLKEGQVGATEQCAVTLDDTGGGVPTIIKRGRHPTAGRAVRRRLTSCASVSA